MKYIGRTKVGKAKTNPSTVLAIVRLPVELKNYAGKWAHIWKVDGDTILIKFSVSKEAEGAPSVYFGVQQMIGGDVEERLRRLETEIEELKNAVFCKKQDNNIGQNIEKCSGRDLNPGHGIESPV